MATVAQLNVQIGVAIADLQKGLKQAERELRTSGQRMARIGTEISTSLSLPLALLGGSAIKAAGDFEALRLAMRSTFQNAGRSIQEADAEVQNLRKSALAPGLDFEQAVKASIRLQSVGFSAEQSRKTIEELANAIASTGGTAENLSSVTVQFAQMISKGKVLAGDLRIVQENLPIISDLMLKAFGTANSEAIQKLGITGKEFVEKITAEMQGLNRVQGGISNAIVNAGSAIKVFLAGIGEEINRVFKIGEKSDAFAASLQGISDGFASLSDSTKKFIVEVGLAVVVLGPAIKIYGAMKVLAGQAVAAFGDLTKALGFVAGKALQAAKAFQALSIAQKATVVGLAIAAVTALYFAYEDYANSLTDAEAAQKAVNDVQRDAVASTEAERAKIGNLVAVLDDNTQSLDHKRNALSALKNISPAYFGDLDLEKGKVEGLTVAVEGYVRALERSAIVKQATDEIAKLSTQLKNIEESGAPTLLQQTGNAVKTLGATLLGGTLAVGLADKAFGNLNESTRTFNQLDVQSATKAKIESLRQLIKENIDLTESENAATASTKSHITATGELSDKAKVLKEVLSDIANESERQKLLGVDKPEEKLKVMESGLKKLLDAGWKPNTKEVSKLANEIRSLSSQINAIPNVPEIAQAELGLKTLIKAEDFDVGKAKAELDRIAGYISPIPVEIQAEVSQDGRLDAVYTELDRLDFESFKKRQQNAATLAESWRDVYIGAAQQISDVVTGIFGGMLATNTEAEIQALNARYATQIKAAEGNAEAQANLQRQLEARVADVRQQAAKKQKRLAIAEAVINTAVAVTKALTSAPPPFNIPAVIAAGIAGAAQVATIVAQPLAKGTNRFGGGVALVGEKGPELVRIPKYSQVFPTTQTTDLLRNAGAGTVVVGGTIRFNGRDLYLLLEKQNQFALRYRGFGLGK